MTDNTKKAQQMAAKFEKKFGNKAGSTGDQDWPVSYTHLTLPTILRV